MNENEESKFPYPKMIQSGLNHPLLLPIIPKIIKSKEIIESDNNLNVINFNNINNKDNFNINKNSNLKISYKNVNNQKKENEKNKHNRDNPLINKNINKIFENNIPFNDNNQNEENSQNEIIKNNINNSFNNYCNQSKMLNNKNIENNKKNYVNKITINAKSKIIDNNNKIKIVNKDDSKIKNEEKINTSNDYIKKKININPNQDINFANSERDINFKFHNIKNNDSNINMNNSFNINLVKNNINYNSTNNITSNITFNKINNIINNKFTKTERTEQDKEQNKIKIQNTFCFDIAKFTSEFNSGNMLHCEKISDDTFEVQIASDCQDKELYHQISTYRVWFYFGVQSYFERELKINIINLNNFLKIYKLGYQICIRELGKNEEPNDFENSYFMNEEIFWKRFDNFNASLDNDNHVILKIKHKFPKRKYVLFAFCFPWSYDKNNEFLKYLKNTINENEDSKIYFHNEVLIQSREKRNLNLITITSKNNIIKNQYEQNIMGLFPNKNRCNKTLIDKPIIFITARVHPGETPGQHMMNGILKLLTDEIDQNAILLRKHFIFKIIPMINVDGVSIGHYRLDPFGYNLNRCYLNPEYRSDPEIYAIKKLFLLYNSIYKLRYYFDLHADMNVKGAYTFGNAIEKFDKHVENVLFGFVFHFTCSHVNWNHCIYSEKSMKTKFKNDNNSKEATSRVHFYKKTGLIHTYTLESSYFKGDFDGQNEVENSELYNISDFEKTGRDCLISILYYEELATNDKIRNSIYIDIPGCREYIAQNVLNNEERFNFNFGLKHLVKEINQIKTWKSINEINIKKIAKGNRNYSQRISPLPKIESDRLPILNKNKKNEEDKKDQIEKHKKVLSFQTRVKIKSPIENKKIKLKS